ncbi:abnormal chemosensory jump 6 [Carabus blaptoides fortunei]
MMGTKNGPTGLHGPITTAAGCFPGRYSPTYRSPEPMARRCMPNPSCVSVFVNTDMGCGWCVGECRCYCSGLVDASLMWPPAAKTLCVATPPGTTTYSDYMPPTPTLQVLSHALVKQIELAHITSPDF